MKEVEQFLLKNGFIEVDEQIGVYESEKAIITFRERHYEVNLFDIGVMYSESLNIYWLVGLLTWYGIIPKDYVQL